MRCDVMPCDAIRWWSTYLHMPYVLGASRRRRRAPPYRIAFSCNANQTHSFPRTGFEYLHILLSERERKYGHRSKDPGIILVDSNW
jgi:hypothetical protein